MVVMMIRPRDIFDDTERLNIENDKSDIKTAYLKFKVDNEGQTPFDEAIFNGIIYKICKEEITNCDPGNFEVSLNRLKEIRLLKSVPVHPVDSDARYTGYTIAELIGDVDVKSQSEVTYTATNASLSQCFTFSGLSYCVVSGEDGNLWLDRNMGATTVASAINTATSYGDLYQWGRSMDGHQIRTSATSVGPSGILVPSVNFLTRAAAPYNWYNGSNIDNLWQTPNYINAVCPPSWRIPNSEEWQTMLDLWTTEDQAGALASNLKLPSAGRRNYDGVLAEVGTIGYYATSNNNAGLNTSKIFRFTNSAANTGYNMERAQGSSVRCFKTVLNENIQTTAAFVLNDDSLGNCLNPTINGTYTNGVNMTGANTIEVDVFVSAAGSYSISTNTVNGMSFSKTGTFPAIGYTSVILTNNAAAPVAAGNFTLTTSAGSSTCNITIPVL
jgi:uncharacterized protein (TIGR02145 family)